MTGIFYSWFFKFLCLLYIYIYSIFFLFFFLAQMKRISLWKRNKQHNPKAGGRKPRTQTKGHQPTRSLLTNFGPQKRRLMYTPYESIWPASSTWITHNGLFFVLTFKREPPSLNEKKLFLVLTTACTLEKGVS
jgi:hypothetical protein